MYTKDQLRQFGDWLASRKDVVTGREIDAYIDGLPPEPSADVVDLSTAEKKIAWILTKYISHAEDIFHATQALSPIIEAEVQRRMSDANRQ